MSHDARPIDSRKSYESGVPSSKHPYSCISIPFSRHLHANPQKHRQYIAIPQRVRSCAAGRHDELDFPVANLVLITLNGTVPFNSNVGLDVRSC